MSDIVCADPLMKIIGQNFVGKFAILVCPLQFMGIKEGRQEWKGFRSKFGSCIFSVFTSHESNFGCWSNCDQM